MPKGVLVLYVHLRPGPLTLTNLRRNPKANLLQQAVEVPGGQRIYVAPTGALSFTAPHSGAIPPGSAQVAFTNTPGPSFGYFSFQGLGATGFVACPVENGGPVYQVFADVEGGDWAKCLGFNALSSQYDGEFAAWEYT